MITLDEQTQPGAISVNVGGKLLARYVFAAAGPSSESPKPYFRPLNSLAGDTLTNFRPNDHPWHHGLCLTLNNVSGTNFWGGPTYVRDAGYQWLSNHGTQRHVTWRKLETVGPRATLAHALEWHSPTELYFREERQIDLAVDPIGGSWTLHWHSRLTNVTGRQLTLGNPHSEGGLVGSHYTGLQFRGARELLDDHLDQKITIVADGGLEGVAAVHGANARWMEWHGQSDTTLNRIVIRFENNPGPLHWFVRRNAPLAAFPLQFDRGSAVGSGEGFEIDHTLTFTGA